MNSKTETNRHPSGDPQGGSRAWLIYSLAALAFGYAFFQRVAPSVMVSELMRDFAIGGALLGTLSALYFYPYVLLQIPLGAILERFGARLLLSSALLLATIGSLIFAFADTVALAYLGRTLIGIGSSVGFLSSLALAAHWFPANRFAFLSGLTLFFGMMSGVLAQGPLAVFVHDFGWRNAMIGLGIFGFVLAALVAAFVRNRPGTAQSSVQPVQSWSQMTRLLGRTLAMWRVWKTAIIASALSGPMLTLGGLWGTPYLMTTYDLERSHAAFLTSLMLFSWAIGAPLSGFISDKAGKRKPLLVGGSILLTAALAMIVLVPQAPLWLTIALLMLSGFSGASMAITFAYVRGDVPTDLQSSAQGIVNSMTVASGALLQPVVGAVLDRLWDGTIINGARIYQPSDFRIAFMSILVVAAIGMIATLTLREGSSQL